MQITRSSIETQKGPADWFTGDVYIDAIAAPAGTSTFAAANVHFTPGARTAWHTHPHGQTIYIAEGVGLCQREGGPIEVIRPGDRVVGTVPAGYWALLGDQDGLAEVAPLGDEAVRVRRPVEREDLCDDWLQLSLLEPRYQRLNHPVEASLCVPPREHVEAKDALVLIHHP